MFLHGKEGNKMKVTVIKLPKVVGGIVKKILKIK